MERRSGWDVRKSLYQRLLNGRVSYDPLPPAGAKKLRADGGIVWYNSRRVRVGAGIVS